MKKIVIVICLSIITMYCQKTISPVVGTTVATKQIQQKLLQIKRNASNLEHILRNSSTVEGFYSKPQTTAQLEEINEAVSHISESKHHH